MEVEKLWPVIGGSWSLRKNRCIRPHCPRCRSGEGHLRPVPSLLVCEADGPPSRSPMRWQKRGRSYIGNDRHLPGKGEPGPAPPQMALRCEKVLYPAQRGGHRVAGSPLRETLRVPVAFRKMLQTDGTDADRTELPGLHRPPLGRRLRAFCLAEVL